MFENRRYVIIPASELSNVDFTEVLETSAETCRLSVDGTKSFVKYDNDMPASVAAIADASQEYTHAEFLTILSTEEWTLPLEEM